MIDKRNIMHKNLKNLSLSEILVLFCNEIKNF